MLFHVVATRDRGWILPRFRSCMHRPVLGCLQIHDERDRYLNRLTRVARLLDPRTGKALELPRPLFDVALTSARVDCLTLTGVERIQDALSDRVIEYSQSWVLYSQDPSTPVKPDA